MYSPQDYWTAAIDALLHPLDTLTGRTIDQALDKNGAASQVTTAAATTGDLLSIVTDIPRMATILVGGILLAAGIFAIAGGSHKDIIQVVKGGK